MNPFEPFTSDRGAECLSDFALDRWLVGAASPAESERFAQHVQTCDRCAARHADLERDAEAFRAGTAALLDRAPAPHTPPLAARAIRPRRLSVWGATGAGLALATAAVYVLMLAPEPDGVGFRSKGTHALGFYVKHRERVRRGGPGEVVAPGDALRFVYTSDEAAHFAVLSLDGSGHASVYYPNGEPLRTIPVDPGRDVPLPISTVLDGVLGKETLLGMFCDRAVELAPVLRALERDPRAPAPTGCEFDRLAVEKYDEETH